MAGSSAWTSGTTGRLARISFIDMGIPVVRLFHRCSLALNNRQDVAASIRGVDGEVVAAVNYTIFSFDANRDRLDEIASLVVHCAENASR